MQLHDLRSPRGSRKRRKIVGRGPGSGHGKTSCRGQKGQTSRSGRGILRSLEGGQIPLIRRLPKLGFRSHRPILYQVVKLENLTKFKEGSVVDPQTLKNHGIIGNIYRPFKVVGEGEVKKALTVQAYSFSKTAVEKLEKAGGKTEIITQKIIKERLGNNKTNQGKTSHNK